MLSEVGLVSGKWLEMADKSGNIFISFCDVMSVLWLDYGNSYLRLKNKASCNSWLWEKGAPPIFPAPWGLCLSRCIACQVSGRPSCQGPHRGSSSPAGKNAQALNTWEVPQSKFTGSPRPSWAALISDLGTSLVMVYVLTHENFIVKEKKNTCPL